MEKLTGLCVLLAALSLAVTDDIFFTEGGTLTLDVSPSYPDPIKHILWKLNGHLVAEWLKDKIPVEFYPKFKGRSSLNTTNGRLVIKMMSQADKGVYSVDINSNIERVKYTAKSLKIVPQPEAVLQPLTCTSSSKVCSVSCNGDTKDAEPVTYSWKIGAKDWEQLGKNIEITEIKNAHDKNFTCRMTNSLSEKVSATFDNPFYRENEAKPSSVVGPVLGGLFAVAFLGGCVGLAVMWKLKKGPFKNSDTTTTTTTTTNPADNSINPTEAHLLEDKQDA